MSNITFYTTSECHLCDQAWELLKPFIDQNVSVNLVDISDSDTLIDLYGIRIPVIKREDTLAEINWPFDEQQLHKFLAR